jgi:uncharacterized protein (DUF1684 family)
MFSSRFPNYALLMVLLLLLSCHNSSENTDKETYQKEIEAWYAKRVNNLKGPKGWLNVSGLFWLKEGLNTMGSHPKNDIVFPQGKITDHAGFFLLKSDSVFFESLPDAHILHKDKPFQKGVIFTHDSLITLSHDSLEWFIIQRDNQYAVRLRDFASQNIKNFTGIERYPLDLSWRVEARFLPHDSATFIPISNVLGQTTMQRSPGKLSFTLQDKSVTLDALISGSELFIIFSDETNGKATYPAGRFLYAQPADENGITIVDFNKAINPPCAFTEYATCPLPPSSNHISMPVTAGEKNYSIHGNTHAAE